MQAAQKDLRGKAREESILRLRSGQAESVLTGTL
jgi:hypothetical protein